MRLKLIRSLNRHDLVVLLLEGTDRKATATVRKTVQNSLKTTADLFQAKPALLTIRSDDKSEEVLLKMLGVRPGQPAPKVFMFFGWAKMAERDMGAVNEEKLLDRYQRLLIDTDVTWPHDFAGDLLINWSTK